MKTRSTTLAVAMAAALAGCAAPTDRVVLLPGADGRPSGAVAVRSTAADGQDVLLRESYAEATVKGRSVAVGRTTAEQVQQEFGGLLALQPARAREWTLHFEVGGAVLTPASQAALAELREALARSPAGELVITGHTDRVGSVEANDRLSLERATAVRDLLVAAGVAAGRILVVGRGERAPVVATADEVAEPRNRRVEIRLR